MGPGASRRREVAAKLRLGTLEQIRERDGLAPARLLEAFLRALPGAGNPFEDLGDASTAQSGIVKRRGEDLASQLNLLDMPLRGQLSQLASVHAVEPDVDLLGGSLHADRIAAALHDSASQRHAARVSSPPTAEIASRSVGKPASTPPYAVYDREALR